MYFFQHKMFDTYHSRINEIDKKYNKYITELEKEHKSKVKGFNDILNGIQREWTRNISELEYVDKPARFILFPLIDRTYDLLEDMTDALEDKNIETEFFKSIYVKAYELYLELLSNPYCSAAYE